MRVTRNTLRAVTVTAAIMALLLPNGWATASPLPQKMVHQCTTKVVQNTVSQQCGYVDDGTGQSPQQNVNLEPQKCYAFNMIDPSHEVPCETEDGWFDGVWGYCRPANPQPPKADPIWEGRTTGVIVDCRVGKRSMFSGLPYLQWRPVAPGPEEQAQRLAEQVITEMNLQTGDIRTSPPTRNEHPNAIVPYGFPIWLSILRAENTTGPITRTIGTGNAQLTVTATLTQTHWALKPTQGSQAGRTISEVTCEGEKAPGTDYEPGTITTRGTLTHSPTCEFPASAYGSHSGLFTITATSTWEYTWTYGPLTGTQTITSEPQTATIKIAEYQALNTTPEDEED